MSTQCHIEEQLDWHGVLLAASRKELVMHRGDIPSGSQVHGGLIFFGRLSPSAASAPDSARMSFHIAGKFQAAQIRARGSRNAKNSIMILCFLVSSGTARINPELRAFALTRAASLPRYALPWLYFSPGDTDGS